MDRLLQLKRHFGEIRERIGADWPLRTAPMHDGSPHIEVSENSYSYVVTERGLELERRTTESEEEVLYWLTASMVFSVAVRYELCHRQPGRDCRRVLFAHELELMDRINPVWRQRKAVEIGQILEQHPYRDEIEA